MDDVSFSSLSTGPIPKSGHEVHFQELSLLANYIDRDYLVGMAGWDSILENKTIGVFCPYLFRLKWFG